MKSPDKNRKREALLYHSEGRPGKIEVVPTKPSSTQKDLSLAYSPGVAEPCLEIEKNPEDAYKYTAKGNLVAVISNGTAVLGLGNIGALAGKPVMEGKGVLFKTFADIDVFDIEVDTTDTDRFIETVRNISVTFGGINLEDIKAPECFEIEERLKKELSIPVMHDDQHGTAIISSAALINALEITGKKADKVKVVINGAGAAAISCARLYVAVGVNPANIVMCDSKGVISSSRTDLNATKKEFATSRRLSTLEEALAGADVFLGLSVADVLTEDMVRSMASDPIVFALANPNPEISYQKAMASRPDIIFATGRTDHPNQVNNVLGFPYIFRGALDVRATTINEEMKIAAVHALSALAKEPVPEIVAAAYNDSSITFGRGYLIPKPFDPRLISHVSSAVAKAAIESGVARNSITDWTEYEQGLERRMGRDDQIMRAISSMARTSHPCRLAFSLGENLNSIKAATYLLNDEIATPILIGSKEKILELCELHHIVADPGCIVDFRSEAEAGRRERYAQLLYEKMSRKGITMAEARRFMLIRDWFTLMMVMSGDADTSLVAYSRRYTKALEPVRQLFSENENSVLSAMQIVSTKKGPMFFTDTAINPDPTSEELVEIALQAHATIRKFGVEPVMAMLSYSNFGSDTEIQSTKVAKAVEILHRDHPEILIDGEMKADAAINRELRAELYPFNKLGDKDVNTFIFPDLSSANISYKLMNMLGGAEVNGPVLMGLEKPNVHLVQDTASTRSIINLGMIAVAEAASNDCK